MNCSIRFALALRRVVLGLSLACASACGHAPDERSVASPRPRADDCSSPRLEALLRTQPSAAVILVLRDGDAGVEPSVRQDHVLRDLGDGFRVTRRYAAVSALAGQLTFAGLERARAHPDVRCVQLDTGGSGTPQLD